MVWLCATKPIDFDKTKVNPSGILGTVYCCSFLTISEINYFYNYNIYFYRQPYKLCPSENLNVHTNVNFFQQAIENDCHSCNNNQHINMTITLL